MSPPQSTRFARQLIGNALTAIRKARALTGSEPDTEVREMFSMVEEYLLGIVKNLKERELDDNDKEAFN